MANEITDNELLNLIKKNPKEFNRVFEKYYPRILYYLKNKLNGDTKTAEDISSETFLKAFTNIKKFQWQGVSLSSWLYTIATNSLIDYIRKSANKVTVEINEEITKSDTNIEEEILKDDFNYKLENIIHTLPDRERNIVTLKFYEGKTNKEIATILEISESNVGTILYRTLKIISTEVKNL